MAARPAGVDHDAGRGGADRLAVHRVEVDAPVEAGAAVDGILTLAVEAVDAGCRERPREEQGAERGGRVPHDRERARGGELGRLLLEAAALAAGDGFDLARRVPRAVAGV